MSYPYGCPRCRAIVLTSTVRFAGLLQADYWCPGCANYQDRLVPVLSPEAAVLAEVQAIRRLLSPSPPLENEDRDGEHHQQRQV